MNLYPPAFAHGDIWEVFPDIFFVTGSSIFEFDGNIIQKSNNMVIVRDGKMITLINTLRLNEDGLKVLDKLGTVANIVRLGAFHDRNDIFYLDHYQAKLWAMQGMVHKDNRQADFLIGETNKVPFPDASFFKFETTSFPEAILHIARLDGVLITCDSIKNWIRVDEYFSEKTGKEFLEQGLIKPNSIDKVWLGAMKPKNSDFARLKNFKFKHLLSAHGQPMLDTADEQLMPTLEELANVDEELVCHYTHFEALENIIKTGRLRSRRLDLLNDSNEFRYSITLTEKIFRDYFNQIISKTDKIYSEQNKEKAYTEMMKMIFDPNKAGYIFCASKYENDDGLLTMWRAYGKTNDTVGIVIKVNSKNPNYYDTYVSYEPNLSNEDQENLKKCDEIKKFIEYILNGESCGKIFKNAVDQILKIGLKYKHPGFKDEREYRICSSPRQDKPDFIELDNFNINNDIYAIIIGPSNAQHILEKNIKDLLEEKNLSIPIKKSSIPFLWDK